MESNDVNQEGSVEQNTSTETHNTTMDKSPITEVYADDKARLIRGAEIINKTLSLLNLDKNEYEAVAKQYPNMDNVKVEANDDWANSLLMALNGLLSGNALSDCASRESADWRQKAEDDGTTIGARKASKFKSNTDNRLSGERAIARLRERLGTGTVLQIPLWHSGIWVTIKSPSEKSLLELENNISNTKVSLGRSTNGMIYSNTSIYTVSHITNFIIRHIHSASILDISADNLKKVIKVTDIPTLMWGMVCSIYPSGYEYSRPCTTNPTKCRHVVKGLLSMDKLFWVDNAALTKYQKTHMGSRNDKKTDEELKRYHEESTVGGPKSFELKADHPVTGENIDTGITVKLEVPSFEQYENSGFKWVDSLEQEVSAMLTVSEKERDSEIIEKARITTLRQYGHWVSEITIDDEVIEDEDTIEESLEAVCSTETSQDNFFDEIGKYIDNSTLSMVAIPKYKCPSCGGEQVGDVHNLKHPHLLPIDVTSTFFTLLDQQKYNVTMSRTL